MARKPRIEFAGAVYHAISRGNRGEAIYQDDEDRRLFLQFHRSTDGAVAATAFDGANDQGHYLIGHVTITR